MYRADSPTLAELHFESRVCDGLPLAALLRLAREASLRNRARGVTGEMRFEGHRFDQVVEGPCDTILMLTSAILSDPRHERIRVRGFRAIEARRYADWRVLGIDCSEIFCALRLDGPIGDLGSVVGDPARAAARGGASDRHA